MWSSRERHKFLLQFYRKAINLRKAVPALRNLDSESIKVEFFEYEKILRIEKRSDINKVFFVCNFSGSPLKKAFALGGCGWTKVLDSSSEAWGGPGEVSPLCLGRGDEETCLSLNPLSLVLYRDGN